MRLAAFKKPILLLLLGLPVLANGGCKQSNKFVAPPPPSVTAATPVQKDVVGYGEFTGTATVIASVDIRARVQGFLQSVHFKDGALVHKGDLLYVIEPSTYQAALDKAAGDLASKVAQLDRAEVEYQRNLRLMKENATSDRELNTSKAGRDSAKADVAVANANLATARINLGYTTIRAPLSGKIGRSQVDAGNLVGAGEYTLLTTIKQYDPIYAYFSLNERDLLDVMKLARDQKRVSGEGEVPVMMGLANDDSYPHQGKLDFSDLGVDPTTGTILLRAVFPNPLPTVIVPGLFVRLRVPGGKHPNALLVPEKVIGVDQRGKYVLVVNNESQVEYRSVQTGILEEGMREIPQGLKPDDRVIVSGIQRARPGAKVNVMMAGQAAAPVAAAPVAASASHGQPVSPAKP